MQSVNATTSKFFLNSNENLSPPQVSMQGAHSSMSWGLYGDLQGHTLQMELLMRGHRLIRHESGAKTCLRYLYSDLKEPTNSSLVRIHMDMIFVVHHTIHTSSLGVWCSSFPPHASKISFRESQDLGGDHIPGLFSAACGDLVQPCREGPGSQHRLHSQCRWPDSPTGEAHLYSVRIQVLLGK